ncbi:MAG: hypothetical protein ABII00_04550 [Elusimicrobiota bacterium]
MTRRTPITGLAIFLASALALALPAAAQQVAELAEDLPAPIRRVFVSGPGQEAAPTPVPVGRVLVSGPGQEAAPAPVPAGRVLVSGPAEEAAPAAEPSEDTNVIEYTLTPEEYPAEPGGPAKAADSVLKLPGGFDGTLSNLDRTINAIETKIRNEAAKLMPLIRHKRVQLWNLKKFYKRYGIDISEDVAWKDFDKRHGVDPSGTIDTSAEAEVNAFEEVATMSVASAYVEPEDVPRWAELSEKAGHEQVETRLMVHLANFGFSCIGYNEQAIHLEYLKEQLKAARESRTDTGR